MSNTSQVQVDPNGKIWIYESKLWFGPFIADGLFLLEKHSKEKNVYSRNGTPKIAEFAWSDLADSRPKVWIVEAKSSVARLENTKDLEKNLEEWAGKLANALIIIAGIKAGAFPSAADLSEVPAYINDNDMRDLRFYLVVVLTADWATLETCQKLQFSLRPYSSESIRAWGLPKDSVYVFNRELAQRKKLTNGEGESE
ncbi:MAG: hypothetical protein NTZ94_18405 [Verrucomicrobia bacterium]|nr:hypothetical protein [Verrucomicrobiota bacterium]